MSARGDIENVLNRYAYGYDEGKFDLVEATFTPTAVMSLRIAGGDLIGPFEGREAIMGLNRTARESQTDQRRHVTTNLVVEELTEDSATVTSMLTLISVADGTLTVLSSGLYRDELVKSDGQWAIQTRHLDLDLPY